MSSHREAPEISKDPVADSTDVYAFVSPDRPGTVTLIANYIPLQEPAGGPNFYEFGDDVLYEIHVDNSGDGVADISYQFRFQTKLTTPGSFLYNTGPIGSLSDPNWNSKQFYSVTRVERRGDQVLGAEPGLPAVQRRRAVHAGLRGQAGTASGPLPGEQRQGLRGPAGRGVLRRPGLDLRPGQPAPAPVSQCLRQGRRAQERPWRERHQPPERALHRDPGAYLPADGAGPPDDRRVDQRKPPAGADIRRPTGAPASTAARSPRYRGWATRSSTRSSSRWARRTTGTGSSQRTTSSSRRSSRTPNSPRCCPSCTQAPSPTSQPWTRPGPPGLTWRPSCSPGSRPA